MEGNKLIQEPGSDGLSKNKIIREFTDDALIIVRTYSQGQNAV